MATRSCAVCGQSYHRRNLVQVWDTRNDGHRDGWHQTTIRVCLRCQTPAKTQQVLRVAYTAPPRALRRVS
jgi:hypothetical protein